MIRIIFVLVILWGLVYHSYAKGEEFHGGTPSNLNPLVSAAHFGFAIETLSSTGFKRVGGSFVFLDLSRVLNEHFEGGIRTSMSGGEDSGFSFYRMGAGPLLTYHVNPKWSLEGALFFFRESGLDGQGAKAYKSRGHSVLFGWERRYDLKPNVQFTFGGFISRHQGDLTSTAATNVNARFHNVHHNVGGSQGVQIGLKMTLDKPKTMD